MENQHRSIKGYRELSQEDIDAMNEVKELAAKVGELWEKLRANEDYDPRWLAAGKTTLQTGFMQITRGITKPEFF